MVETRTSAHHSPRSTRRRSQRIGEIVEASTTQVKAVAPVPFEPPAFGSFVRCDSGGRTTYAVVARVQHAPLDPSRRAVPLGLEWDELQREQPQILELIITEFDALIVAFAEPEGGIRPWLPPAPPRVHEFVHPASAEEVRELTEDLSFVRTLSAGPEPVDELVAAAIREASMARKSPRVFLVRAGREVADLFRQDYERARGILRRIAVR
jgi:hypothetical protein